MCAFFDLREGKRGQGAGPEDESGGGGSSRADEGAQVRSSAPMEPSLKTVFKNVKQQRVVSLYTISLNPSKEYEIGFAGSCSHVSLFDIRKFNSPFGYLCPRHLQDSSEHVTGIKYNWCGSELIATYNDEHLYSFDPELHIRGANSMTSGGTSKGSRKPALSSSSSSSSSSLQSSGAAGGGESKIEEEVKESKEDDNEEEEEEEE